MPRQWTDRDLRREIASALGITALQVHLLNAQDFRDGARFLGAETTRPDGALHGFVKMAGASGI